METENKSSAKRKQHVKQFFLIRDNIQNLIKALGVEHKSTISSASDIADLYFYSQWLIKSIDTLRQIPYDNYTEIGELFSELRVIIGEMKSHINDIQPPLECIAKHLDQNVVHEKEFP